MLTATMPESTYSFHSFHGMWIVLYYSLNLWNILFKRNEQHPTSEYYYFFSFMLVLRSTTFYLKHFLIKLLTEKLFSISTTLENIKVEHVVNIKDKVRQILMISKDFIIIRSLRLHCCI